MVIALNPSSCFEDIISTAMHFFKDTDFFCQNPIYNCYKSGYIRSWKLNNCQYTCINFCRDYPQTKMAMGILQWFILQIYCNEFLFLSK